MLAGLIVFGSFILGFILGVELGVCAYVAGWRRGSECPAKSDN